MNIYKYRGCQSLDRDLDSAKNNKAWFSSIESLNDPSEAKVNIHGDFFSFSKAISLLLHLDPAGIVGQLGKGLDERFIRLLYQIKKYGVYSTSRGWDNVTMWAHYAENFRGFCIEYDADWLQVFNCQRFVTSIDVEYQKSVPIIDLHPYIMEHHNDMVRLVKKIIGVKSIPWEHENEVRLLTEPHGYIEYDFRAVKGIYFGYNTPDDLKSLVMEELKHRKITYYLVEPETNSYALKRTRIPDKYDNDKQYPYTIAPLKQHAIWITEKTRSYEKLIRNAVEIVRRSQLCGEIIAADVPVAEEALHNLTIYVDIMDKSNQLRKWYLPAELIESITQNQ